MTYLAIYNALTENEITLEQAADLLHFTPKGLKVRISKHGHTLPILLTVLDKIKANAITRDEAAAVLQTTTRQVNKIAESWGVRRPLKPYLFDRASAQVKWELHKKFAIDFIAGSTDLLEAAENANIGDRQMRRVISDLLKLYCEMPFKDLNQISLTKRRRLAENIEKGERLSFESQSVLNLIADGKLSIAEVALNRVLFKRPPLKLHAQEHRKNPRA